MKKSTRVPIIDGHNDCLRDIYLKEHGDRTFFKRSDRGHVDLPRALDSGLAAGFFAINPPDPSQGPLSFDKFATAGGYDLPLPSELKQTYAAAFTDKLIKFAGNLAEQANGEVEVLLNSADLKQCLKRKALGIILHLEGAEAIKPDLSNLADYYDRGVRSIGPVWSRSTAFGHGVPFRFPGHPDTGPALTEAGIELVQKCNQMGILIDLSHLNEQGFWDVAALSDKPLVVTHTAAHNLCQSTRNLTDDQIDAVGESGGLIGINFCVGFIRTDGRNEPDTPLYMIVDHIRYVADRIGIDHVALGSDFDGASIPKELGDVTGLVPLVEELRSSGFDRASLDKILWKNWVRILEDTWL